MTHCDIIEQYLAGALLEEGDNDLQGQMRTVLLKGTTKRVIMFGEDEDTGLKTEYLVYVEVIHKIEEDELRCSYKLKYSVADLFFSDLTRDIIINKGELDLDDVQPNYILLFSDGVHAVILEITDNDDLYLIKTDYQSGMDMVKRAEITFLKEIEGVKVLEAAGFLPESSATPQRVKNYPLCGHWGGRILFPGPGPQKSIYINIHKTEN